MSHIAYVNGCYVNHAQAQVHIEDRGYQFADGVYDYIAFYNGAMVDEVPHLQRLQRSLAELNIPAGHIPAVLPIVIRELIERNHRRDGAVYIQVTRGAAKRDHPFPGDTKPALVVTIWGSKMADRGAAQKGVKVITLPDMRWGRCDIKTIALLANVLAKQEAVVQGAKEAWLYKPDGLMTEGAVSNAFLVKNGVIFTHPKTHAILPGITRDVVLGFAHTLGIPVEEKAFFKDDLASADEAFLTSTSSNVQPVVMIDGVPVGDQTAGAITLRLMDAYSDHLRAQTGKIW